MKPGDRIRITKAPDNYPFFSVGDEATVVKEEVTGTLLCDFTSNSIVCDDGQWWAGEEGEYEVIEIYRPGVTP